MLDAKFGLVVFDDILEALSVDCMPLGGDYIIIDDESCKVMSSFLEDLALAFLFW